MFGKEGAGHLKLYIIKNLIGFFFVGLHFMAITLCFVLLKGEMDQTDFHTVVLIVSPVMIVYTLAYFRDVARNMMGRPTSDDERVIMSFVVLSCFFSVFFGVYVVWTIWNFSGSGESPDTLKLDLALVEVFAGAFVGLIFETLFGYKRPVQNPASSEPEAVE